MDTQADPSLVKYVIISLTAVFSLGLIVFGIVGGIAFSKVKVGAGKSFGLLFQRGNFLRIITVFAVIQAVIFLALLGKLNEGAIAVLSGVAGFVLGGLDKSKEKTEEEE
jgi:large-conductance mechanosensitive channel